MYELDGMYYQEQTAWNLLTYITAPDYVPENNPEPEYILF